MTPAQARKKFDALRARYLAAKKKTEDQESVFSARYHHHRDWRHWITPSEKRRVDMLRARQDKVGDELFVLIQSISPRSWGSEDAVRPRDERLSTTPPLAYGATRHME